MVPGVQNSDASNFRATSIELERIRFVKEILVDRVGFSVETDPGVFKRERVRFVAEIAGRSARFEERADVSYPSDWWQAFRERWLPAWWLRRHPVRVTTRSLAVRGEARALFPEVWPLERHKVALYVYDRVDPERT